MSHRSPLELCSLATIGTQDCRTDFFFCPAALELYIVVEVSYDQQQNYLSEDVNANEEETIQLPEPEQLDLPF